jgi:septal ring factor EnvC (AmiA/AmiB activator)
MHPSMQTTLHHGGFRTLAAALVAILALVASAAGEDTPAADSAGAAAPAAGPEAVREETERALATLREDLERQREVEARIAGEVAALEADRAALNAELLATAGRIGELETVLGHVENRIAALVERENDLKSSLRSRSGVLAELIAALQRMGRRPPPAVLISPGDALETVRTAMLLGAVLPGLRLETEALATDLAELTRLKREIDGERARLLAQTRALGEQRTRIALLIEAKRLVAASSAEELASVRRRAEELAARAQDMEELIASLDREIAVAEREAAASATRSPQEALGALRDPARLEPAMPFADTKGLLPMPAAGAVVREFGAPDEFGTASRGITIATRANAQVIAPADGWVVYAGPFRSYGELLILNVGDGYHVLLAGMDAIAVDLGQFVLAGEPVGQMGGVVLASAANVTVGRSQPLLYVEFRQDGQSIDPGPWWASGRNGAGG